MTEPIDCVTSKRVRLQALAWPQGAGVVAPALKRRPTETAVDFGRRAISTAVFHRGRCGTISWPNHDHEASAWLRSCVAAVANYVDSLPGRTYCGCRALGDEVVTAVLHTWLTPGHLCDTECRWNVGDQWLCHGQVWADCQSCARTDTGPVLGIGLACDRCQQPSDGSDVTYLAASCGDVAVIARLCTPCLRREGITLSAVQPD